MCRCKGRYRKVAPLWSIALLMLMGGLASACAASPTHQAPMLREESIPGDAVKMTPDGDPTPPILHVGGWQAPIPVPGDVNTAGAEDSPFVTPDGGMLYSLFTPDPSVPPEKQLLDGVTGIYVARREGSAWGQVARVILQTPGKLALDGCPTVAGDTLWFCSAREGYTGVNTFAARLVDGRWGDPQYAGDLLGREYGAGELHVVGDEMYYHSPRAGRVGQFDIWVTRLVGGAWQPPENVAPSTAQRSTAGPT